MLGLAEIREREVEEKCLISLAWFEERNLNGGTHVFFISPQK
jgi:hypothetical protein